MDSRHKLISPFKIVIFVIFVSLFSSARAEYYFLSNPRCIWCARPYYKVAVHTGTSRSHKPCRRHVRHGKRRSWYSISVYCPCPGSAISCGYGSCSSSPCGMSRCDAYRSPCSYPRCHRVRRHHRVIRSCPGGCDGGYWGGDCYSRMSPDYVVFSSRRVSSCGTWGCDNDPDIFYNYNPDMSTADDNPTIYPDMDIDR